MFSKSYSPCGLLRSKNHLSNASNDAQKVNEKENAEKDERLLTKIEDFRSVLQVLAFGFFTRREGG